MNDRAPTVRQSAFRPDPTPPRFRVRRLRRERIERVVVWIVFPVGTWVVLFIVCPWIWNALVAHPLGLR